MALNGLDGHQLKNKQAKRKDAWTFPIGLKIVSSEKKLNPCFPTATFDSEQYEHILFKNPLNKSNCLKFGLYFSFNNVFIFHL